MLAASGFILAGGFSRRFGENKALYPFRRLPLIQYAIDVLSNRFPEIFIVSKNPEDFAGFGMPILRDELEFQTPLTGILTGLRQSGAEWNFFLACDMPLMTVGVIDRLYGTINSSDFQEDVQVVVPGTNRKLQPLAAFYHKNLAGGLPKAIQNKTAVRDWIKSNRYCEVPFEDKTEFVNINRKEALLALETS